ncbi:hypothetical protein MN116_008199 [Schistosoma mekongi]|uniref:Uncharacterized protein n=1 Tax=Schistosoma mekongi TaxID=38744 RepID=A0AAE1Z5L7_SCHME|nr:hypothetical protein MN116_008199 [Schistosoma mekongi]
MKSILKNRGVNVQRSTSLDTKKQISESVDEEDDSDCNVVEKSCISKKRAFIRDEHGVCRPGELDEDVNMTRNHETRSSVVDRTAAERISYRLVQQRSLDFGLYCQLDRFNIDSCNNEASSSHQLSINHDNINELQHNESLNCINSEFPILLHHDDDDDDVINDVDCNEERNIHQHEMYINPRIKEIGKEFTIKDVLGHRIPEFETDNSSKDDDSEI